MITVNQNNYKQIIKILCDDDQTLFYYILFNLISNTVIFVTNMMSTISETIASVQHSLE
jgi:hypothetical protein